MIWKIAFLFFTIAQQGPIQGTIPEKQTFKSEAECKAWGETMAPRVQDWIRGRVSADWDQDVLVKFNCQLGGQDA